MIDWSRTALSDGAEIHDQIITWVSAKTPALDRIASEATVTLVANVTIKNAAPDSEGSWEINMTPTLVAHKLDNEAVDKTYEGGSLRIPISSPLNLKVEARYFSSDGTTLGSGPLPPKVGSATRYRLIWSLSGAVHRITNLVVKSVLPDGVKVIENSANTAFGTFSVAGNQPSWQLPSVEAGIEPSVEFTVELTPGKTDVGKILVLSGQTTAQGDDDVTQGSISAIGSVATTNLDTDSTARGKGVVEAAQ